MGMALLCVCFATRHTVVEVCSVDVMSELTTIEALSKRIFKMSVDLCTEFHLDSESWRICLFLLIKFKFFTVSLSGRI